MQRHVEALFRSLRGKARFTHIVPSRDGNSATFEVDGVPVIRTASLNIDGSLALSPAMVFEAWRVSRAAPFDAVHLHFPDPMAHVASLVVPARVPRIITWHADVVRQKRMMKLYAPMMMRALGQAAAIIAPTAAHVSSSPHLARFARDPRLHIIPFGFDLQRFGDTHPLTSSIRRRHDGPIILALGRHVYYKGFDVLIRAMTGLPADVTLLIAGDGPLTPTWRRLAGELHLDDRVHFVGTVPESELAAWYQACDIFCLPATSKAEAFGIVQVEAMAAGKPVISTRLGTGVDVVNRDGITGLVVPPDDSEALRSAIARLLSDDPLRRLMGQNAFKRAREQYSDEAMANQTLKLYQAVARQQ